MANLLMTVASTIDASVDGASQKEPDRDAKLRVGTKARVERALDEVLDEEDEAEDGEKLARGDRRR